MDQETSSPSHVLIFPLPIQGHVNSMLNLSELLCLAGLRVTFLIPSHIHVRLLSHTDVQSRYKAYPFFSFLTLPDGIYQGNVSTNETVMSLYNSLEAVAKPFLIQLLSLGKRDENNNSGKQSPINCIISDGILNFVVESAEDICVPIIYFRTISACSFWAYFCIPQLIAADELPFTGDNMDQPIENVNGMEGFLRRRDLPSFCRGSDVGYASTISHMTRNTTKAHALILNTFEDLEGPIVSYIRTQCPNVYSIGPLHSHLKSRLASEWTASSNSLWEEDKGCITWLNQQPSKSVIYVSFGSIATLTREQLIEFWYGLVHSGIRFLWVIRPDSIMGQDGKDQVPDVLEQCTKERGYMVGWAPQEEVLGHRAVGGFLTHSGWNSTLESIVEGVPMLCWPFFADQQINSRFVEAVWKVGLDMKDTCDRMVVEKMIKDLMDFRRNELMKSAGQMAEMARKCVSEGGSSYRNLDLLVEKIRLMGLQY